MKKAGFIVLIMLLANWSVARVASEYTVINISGWTTNQLAELPYFDRYVPLSPAGSGFGFEPKARNGLGVVSGLHGTGTTLGAFVEEGSQTDIAPWGTYSWSYSYWDGRDWHYSSGSVTKSPAQDVNVHGQIVGYATLPGGGSSSLDYETHGYLRNTVSGEHLDLTPDAHRADFRGISDHGEIVGTWSTTNQFHSFRRSSDGTMYDFTSPGGSVSPDVINNHGVIAGKVVTYGSPWLYHLFVSTETNAMETLPWPSQGTPENGNIYDINDHGIIVGRVYKGSPVETQAVRWYPDDDGWATDDFNELLADGTGDYVLDRAIAVNDAGHVIVKGHPDGSDVIGTHTLLLTPDVFPAPSVITLSAEGIGPTNAMLVAKVNACNSSTTFSFEHGLNLSYGTILPITGTFTGNVPALVETELTGLAPHTTYHFRGSATNDEGTTLGEDQSFTTPYDYATWATEQFGTNTAISGTSQNPDGDTAVNLIEYAFGGQAMIPDNPASAVVAVEDDDFTIAFTRPTDRSGVDYIVEYATDLEGPWSSGTNAVELVSAVGETVVVQSTTAISSEPLQFMRVRIAEQ